MLNKIRTGCAFGGFLALFHAIWAIMVALNFAKPTLDFVFKLHMIQNPYILNQFDWVLSVSLFFFTAVVGFVFGFIFAGLYNWAHKGAKKK